ncbi:BTB/POZ domain-containing protein 16 isoform X3 [Lepisosteus oculatus]|uniref:BTB/POZ domain-containing protein 16 isoform X3 n=1 Tax=Lepisosteus oculatus TaxID=7918 RepID=UPI00073FD245|nr:PREDICTED: BTB/POZ domain-containing protein 16 isoform X3 [Lepisosteus oculatus]
MAQVLPRDGSGTIPRLAPGHPLQNTFVPNPPPTHMTPAAACIISLLQAPYKALEDKPSEEVRVPSSPRGRLRKQAGNTNRWQLPFPLGSDLLGQAQAARAVRATINATLRGIRTADSPFCECEEPTGPEPTLPRLVLSRGTATPTHQTCCVRLTGSPGPATPEDLFYLYSRRVAHNTSPDVILECLGSYWELHCPYLTKSVTLTELYTTAKEQRVKTSSNGTDCPGSRGDRKSDRMGSEPSRRFTLGTSKPASSNPLLLRLPVNDPTISKEALSVALRSLYSSEPRVQLQGVEGVLSAAALLGMPLLFRRCLSAMMNNISPCTVCHFHSVASKYREAELQRACERWLELSLVTQLQFHISLRDLSLELLQKTLHSPRLFTPSEYQLLRTVLYWVFLQLNPGVQTLPSHSSILTFFISLPKTGVFLEQDVGQTFTALFQSVRLHGITERAHLEEIQQINVLPQSWLLLLFSRHYYAEPQYCTLTAALYGFYFLLKATRLQDCDSHGFSIQRLKHWDPALSLRACERRPFSLLSERGVQYQITVQGLVGSGRQWQEFCTGPICQDFGITKRSSKSQVFKVKGLSPPIYVTFALVFPAF